MAQLGNSIVNGIFRVNGKIIGKSIKAENIEGNLSGNALTATKLQTARKINGVAFDGTKDITIQDSTKLPLSGGVLNGILRFPDVTSTTYPAKSHYIEWTGSTDGARLYYEVESKDKGNLIIENLDDGDAGTKIRNVSTKKEVTIRNGSVFAETFNGALNGNASTATKLQTARKINGISFDGTSNIMVYDNTKLPLSGGNITGSLKVQNKAVILEGDSRLTNARPASDVAAWAKAPNKPTYTKAEIGLGNVDNTADNQKSVKYATGAGSATKLQTPRKINGVDFDGTKDILIPNRADLSIGSIAEYSSLQNIPNGWLICDGRAVSRTTYADLFKIIGTTYGAGDGKTTFNLPDKRGRVSVGYNSSESEFNALGKKGGEKSHRLTESQMPSHVHKGMTWYGNSNTEFVTLNEGSSSGLNIKYSGGTNNQKDGLWTASAGGGQAFNLLQPFATTIFIIKALKVEGELVANKVGTIVDNLTSTSATDALSAHQGKILNDTKISTDGTTKNIRAMSLADFNSHQASIPNNTLVAVW